ncbi:MAG: hypothetical protein Q4C65_04960 [Eubacteriales bacterium]|nr:hypothetical protein [Eubacteriales bacterium]
MTRDEIRILQGKPYPMGLTVTGEREVNLAAALHGKEECGVILYPKKGGNPRRFPFPRENRTGNIHCMRLSGISMEEYEYNFYQGSQVVTDPYARRVCGNECWGRRVSPQLRGSCPEEDFAWGNDVHPLIPLRDTVLYQLHVRGFTRHSSSGVKKKGTFAGLAEKLPYLRELGVTAAELMPAYEFLELERPRERASSMEEAARRCREKPEERPRINYWGFKEGYYFAPKASYSGGQPETEFKELVKLFHENGMEIIMQFYFPREIKRGFILEVLRFWVCEYHIDGIHLMGESMPTELLATDPLLANTKLFYYDFPAEDIYGSRERPDYKNLACCRDVFQYDMRRFLKGDEGSLQGALECLRQNPAQTGVVNYMASYEGFSLADLVSYDRRHNEDNGEDNQDGNPYNASWNCGAEGPTRKKSVLRLRRQQLRNAVLLLLTAQGTPMLTAGDEFCQSRQGNNNAYCQDNAVSWIDWRLAEKNRDFLEFVKAALRLRSAHPVLHQPEELTMQDYAACGYPDLSWHGREAWRLVTDRLSLEAGVMYCGRYAYRNREQEDDFFYIAYNMHWIPRELALPDLPAGMRWEKVMDSADGQCESDGLVREKKLTVPGRAVWVLESFGSPLEKGKRAARKGKKSEGI